MGPIGAFIDDETGQLRRNTACVVVTTAMIDGGRDHPNYF